MKKELKDIDRLALNLIARSQLTHLYVSKKNGMDIA